MSTIEIVVAVLRGVHVAALVSLFGTLLFPVVVVEHDASHLRGVLYRLARISAVCALVAGIVWGCVESAAIADADSVSATLSAVPVVAFQTQYGQWFVVRCVLLIAVLLLPLRRRIGLAGALLLAGGALAVQPMIGHAGALGGGVGAELIVSETLHLLAAGAWLGGLLPLFIAVTVLPHEAAATSCRNFTPIGLSAVLLLMGTAIVQVSELMGGLPGLFGTTYGHVALVKLGLFVVLLVLAALNRLVLTEHLAHNTSSRHMRVSIAFEMALGMAVIITAGFLASLTPGTHEQPVWPFPLRPSSAALYEPLLRDEVVDALIAVGVGLCVAVVGALWRRIRWVAFAAAVVIIGFAAPHLDLLFVEAFPTSFYASPTEFAATAIVHGQKLFAANCTACHGIDARGDGPAAKSLPIPPADLTAEHFWAHSDGELYWYVSHGFTAPDGGIAMPGFGNALSSEAIWDLIDYLRAHNAGESMRTSGAWSHPVPVPQFDARCPGKGTLDLDDLRGRVLRIIAEAGDEQAEPAPLPEADATTIFVVRRVVAGGNGTACITSEPETWTAFSILLGVTPDALAGAQVLVDRSAWLRVAWRPGEAGDWNDPRVVEDRIRDINAHPLAVVPTAHVHAH